MRLIDLENLRNQNTQRKKNQAQTLDAIRLLKVDGNILIVSKAKYF